MRLPKRMPAARTAALLLAAGPCLFAAATAPAPPSARPSRPPDRPISPPTPRKWWRVDVGLSPRGSGDDYTLSVSREPTLAFRFSFRPRDVRVTILDSRSRPVRTNARFMPAPGTPGLLAPKPDPDHPDREVAELVLRFERNDLKPDMYQFRASFPVSATDLQTGKPLRLPLARSYDERVYLPPLPDHAPSLASGQQFLCFPESGQALPDYRNAEGQPVPRRDLVLRVFTLQQIDRKPGARPRLWFSVERLPGQVQLESDGDVLALPQLYPIVEDKALRRLRSRYEGKRVWSYGGGGAECVASNAFESGAFETDHSTSFTLRRLVRIHGAGIELGIGSAFVGDARASVFLTRSPLVAILAQPRNLQIRSFSWGYSGPGAAPDTADSEESRLKRCAGFYRTFADTWDLEREYSLVPFWKAHPEWPPRVCKAVMAGSIRRGMTPDMVGWAVGWPSDHGTIPEIKTWKDWRYDDVSPFNYWVHFRHGRVTHFGSDGRLP